MDSNREYSYKVSIQINKLLSDESITNKIAGILSSAKPDRDGQIWKNTELLKRFLVKELSQLGAQDLNTSKNVKLGISGNKKVKLSVKLQDGWITITEGETLEIIQKIYNQVIIEYGNPHKPQNYFDDEELHSKSSIRVNAHEDMKNIGHTDNNRDRELEELRAMKKALEQKLAEKEKETERIRIRAENEERKRKEERQRERTEALQRKKDQEERERIWKAEKKKEEERERKKQQENVARERAKEREKKEWEEEKQKEKRREEEEESLKKKNTYFSQQKNYSEGNKQPGLPTLQEYVHQLLTTGPQPPRGFFASQSKPLVVKQTSNGLIHAPSGLKYATELVPQRTGSYFYSNDNDSDDDDYYY